MKTIKLNNKANDYVYEAEIRQAKKQSRQMREMKKSRKAIWANFGE